MPYQYALIGAENVGAMVGRLKAAGGMVENHVRQAMAEIAHRCYDACVESCKQMVYGDKIGDSYEFTWTLLRSHYLKPAGGENILGGLNSTASIENTNAQSEWAQFGFTSSIGDLGRTAPGSIIAYFIGNNADQGEGGYAPFVHDGTWKMHPRPWMETALMKEYEPATNLLDDRIVRMWNGLL